jgi:hypothetical protein
MGLVLPVGSYDLSPDQLQASYARLSPVFWLFVVLYPVAQGLLLTHSYLLRRALNDRRGGLAGELMHRAFSVGLGLLIVSLLLHVLPTFRIAAAGDLEPVTLLYDIGVFVELLALAVIAVAFAAAAFATWRAGASKLAVWLAALLAPLSLGAAAAVVTDPATVVFVDLVTAGLASWVLVSALTVLPSRGSLDGQPLAVRHRPRRVRAGLVLVAAISLVPILHSLDTAEPLGRVVAYEAALAAASLVLVPLVWRGHRDAAVALLVLQLALALRVFRPVVWWLEGAGLPSPVWIDAAIGGVLSTSALLLVLPAVSGRAVSARPGSA